MSFQRSKEITLHYHPRKTKLFHYRKKQRMSLNIGLPTDDHQSFQQMLPAPVDQRKETTIRRKSLNYKAQERTRDLFNTAEQCIGLSVSSSSKTSSSKVPTTWKNILKVQSLLDTGVEETWFCSACQKTSTSNATMY